MARMVETSFDTVLEQAEAGIADAQYSLGLLFSTGHEAPLDYVSAHTWLNIAAMHGNAEARRLRAEIAQDMEPDEIALAQRQAREWLKAHAH
jgi:TPR repeat protein